MALGVLVDLKSVIEDLVYDKGLDRDKVLDSVCSGIAAALEVKNPGIHFKVFPSKTNTTLEADKFSLLFDVFTVKKIVNEVDDSDKEIDLNDAQRFDENAQIDGEILIPYAKTLSRIEIASAKNFISESIRQLEQERIYNLFKNRIGMLISGAVHKLEFGGISVNLGEAIAFLPQSLAQGVADTRSGAPIKAILKQVHPFSGKNAQLVLDRSSAEFVVKLMELDIPELFEGLIEIVKIERTPGYRTKVVLRSKAKNIDSVGACIGVAGARIRSVRNELGDERIDLIAWSDDQEVLLKRCLKTRDSDKEVGRVVFHRDGETEVAEIWVDPEQKSILIGKGGGNISLASRIMGMHIKIHQDGLI